jgi:demethoxyubiquinone hydroxylase (CLK1/Coq7/Cat5 family)
VNHDVSVIRPEMRVEQVKLRGRDLPQDRRRSLRRGLRTLHTLEIMAVNIYKCQMTKRPCELNRVLAAAMCNEMTHMQDFQTKLYEYGLTPSKTRFSYWLVGYFFGLGSRLLGTRRILKTGIWVENKAVRHYGELLESVEWDEETRAVVEKDRADEEGHVARWRWFWEHPEATC